MYHVQVLRACVDILNVLPVGHRDRPLIRSTVRRMLTFLSGVTHPDGCIGLFNDATVDGAPSPSRIVSHAGDVDACLRSTPSEDGPLAAFPETGYYSFRGGAFALIIDAGPIGPDHQPAHGHADAMSFELSVQGERIVTDTGVPDYDDDAERHYCRGTVAHNTVTVDGTDQAEVWGAFRVGKRFAPTVEEASCHEGTLSFTGSFRGYAQIVGDGVVHRRYVRCDSRAGELRIRDCVNGRGRHSVTSRIHLHPEVAIVERTPETVRLERSGVQLVVASSAPVVIEDGWYSPRFGERQDRRVIRIGTEVELPTELGFELRLA